MAEEVVFFFRNVQIIFVNFFETLIGRQKNGMIRDIHCQRSGKSSCYLYFTHLKNKKKKYKKFKKEIKKERKKKPYKEDAPSAFNTFFKQS